ncbi:MAG: PleD family two-component system response regulator [Planctomycetota bacterium]
MNKITTEAARRYLHYFTLLQVKVFAEFFGKSMRCESKVGAVEVRKVEFNESLTGIPQHWVEWGMVMNSYAGEVTLRALMPPESLSAILTPSSGIPLERIVSDLSLGRPPGNAEDALSKIGAAILNTLDLVIEKETLTSVKVGTTPPHFGMLPRDAKRLHPGTQGMLVAEFNLSLGMADLRVLIVSQVLDVINLVMRLQTKLPREELEERLERLLTKGSTQLDKDLPPWKAWAAGKLIMVVDDTRITRKAIVAHLNHAGYKTLEAGTSDETLQILGLSGGNVGLILLDINMPRVNGIDIQPLIRKIPGCSDIPIIMCSAQGDKETVIRCIKMGAIGFISKPFKAEDVLAKIEKALEDQHKKVSGG